MNTLLVEDDDDKRQQIASFLKELFTSEVTEAVSVQSGVRALMKQKFDLVILDMSMTTFDPTSSDKTGGRPQSFGGREILLQMKRRGVESKAIVVTQYDLFGQGSEVKTLEELDKELRESFPVNYVGAIFYSSRFSGWQDKLNKMITKSITRN